MHTDIANAKLYLYTSGMRAGKQGLFCGVLLICVLEFDNGETRQRIRLNASNGFKSYVWALGVCARSARGVCMCTYLSYRPRR